ncbi:amidohydrolase family protein [Kineococcus sp. SYSU DK003]|uniref:amidohydrolase family protein n=1 Tax=Kineococcus sp. SYSU DK003 TaxID=3383124 RepID=UPI003D7CFF18
MRTDCHQHLWPAPLLEALRARRTPPRLEGWTLHLPGEPPTGIDPAAHDVTARAAAERADGTRRVCVSLSSPLGLEHLPGEEAGPLLEAWHSGALALGDPFVVWAATPVSDLDPDALAGVLTRERVVGWQVPATAMADPAAVDRLAPLLAACERAGKPVLVHPGPAAGGSADVPGWWPALVPYVQQLHAAWTAWHVRGRARHPGLRVAFVALAGLAVLHHERLTARGGALGPLDPGVFYETSSYGPRAIDAVVRVTGVDPLVLGTDRPYAQPFDATALPGFGAAFAHALTTTGPARLLEGKTP